jgi:hypothetical protein
MIAPGAAGVPVSPLPLCAGAGVGRGQRVQAAGGEAELFSRLKGRQCALAEGVQDMANKGGGMAMGELLMLFKDPQDSRRRWLRHQSFRRASLRSPSSKTGGAAKHFPVLLTTRSLLFCSPRDT